MRYDNSHGITRVLLRLFSKNLNCSLGLCPLLLFTLACEAGPLLPPVQTGNLLKMTNGNVRLDYDLSTGRANFYWQNTLKISGFYAGAGLYSGQVLTNYVTDTIFSSHSWTVTNNQVEVTSTRIDLPTMKQ